MAEAAGDPSCSAPSCAGPPPAPEPVPERHTPVDFVCEADVAAAKREQRRIYIGPRTIVTAAARDAAGTSDILVMA
jgi:hypothetical protein